MVSIFFFFQNLGFLSSLTYLYAWFIFFILFVLICFHHICSFRSLLFTSPTLVQRAKLKRQINRTRGVFQLDFFNFICFIVYFFCCATICQTRYANIFVFCFVLLLFVVFFDRRSFSAFSFFFLTAFFSFSNIVSNDGGDEQEELSFFPEK